MQILARIHTFVRMTGENKNKIIDFNRIYCDYYKRSFAFVKSYILDDAAAEDIVSESLISLWQEMKKTEIEHPLSFLLTLLRNRSLNFLRDSERRQEILSSLSDTMLRDLDYRIQSLDACDPKEIFSSEVTLIIERTLNALPAQTRRVFEMSRYEGLPVKAIATELDISTKAVEYHITKALKLLRPALKDYLPIYFLLFS